MQIQIQNNCKCKGIFVWISDQNGFEKHSHLIDEDTSLHWFSKAWLLIKHPTGCSKPICW